tara:strand:- start:2856 stop:3341 length:486 start_codon:yes stop_codon:yes gene_type:complete
MAYEAVFSQESNFLGLSNSEDNKNAWNVFTGLIFKNISEDQFNDVANSTKRITGFSGETVDFFDVEAEIITDGVVTKVTKEDVDRHVTLLKEKHENHLKGHNTSFNSSVTASLEAVNALNTETIVTWNTDSEGNKYIESKISEEQVIREANSSILSLLQIS